MDFPLNPLQSVDPLETARKQRTLYILDRMYYGAIDDLHSEGLVGPVAERIANTMVLETLPGDIRARLEVKTGLRRSRAVELFDLLDAAGSCDDVERVPIE